MEHNFKETIKTLTDDLHHQFQRYQEEQGECICENPPKIEFIEYLQKTGLYQTYLTTITKVASGVVRNKFAFNEPEENSKAFQNFVAEIYTYLVTMTNGVINELLLCGEERTPVDNLAGADSLWFYAREATEMGADILAERYYLERICQDQHNASFWFDYAVFKLQLEETEKAIECVKEALANNPEHKYSLLLYGILLMDRGQPQAAETIFLDMMLLYPRWLEGWATFWIFYAEIDNMPGADLCEEMAKKYLNDPCQPTDYISANDELLWYASICPKTIFFQTAVLLLKIRAYSFADKALAWESLRESGLCHYYQGVLQYYNNNYEHALVHLNEAERLHGLNYATGSMLGHCYVALNQPQQAKIYYVRLLEDYDRPDDLHMVYINLAIIYEQDKDDHKARKLLLLACKYSPTPYTWLATGLIFFSQRDLLSAEECLSQANICDNRLAEAWGYLALVNIQLNRIYEAEMCYHQTFKNNCTNDYLLENLKIVHEYLNKRK